VPLLRFAAVGHRPHRRILFSNHSETTYKRNMDFVISI
jgi:hypothetical protein